MFTILFATGVRIWDVPANKVSEYIVTSEQDVSDVYEQATPVTKRVRKELRELFEAGRLKNATPAARRFIIPA